MDKKVIVLTCIIFLLAFLVKCMPLYMGYFVSLGYVDTSFHIATGLDVSEGDFKSLLHPWWHLKNRYVAEGVEIVDRNAASFFYPPLIHLLLAASYMIWHPGIATIIVISCLFSISAAAVFFFCRSFGLHNLGAATASLLVAFSLPLFEAQGFGLWTFPISLSFVVLSWALLRWQSEKALIGATIISLLAILTHWMAVVIIVLIGILEFGIYHNKYARRFIAYTLAGFLPFFVLVLLINSPLNYVGTFFPVFFVESPFILLFSILGLAIAWKKHIALTLLLGLTIICTACHYLLNTKIIFSDMLQFALPFFYAFYIGSLVDTVRKGWKRTSLLLLLGILVLVNTSSMWHIVSTTKPSIANEDFNALLQLRKNYTPDSSAVLAIDNNISPWWITIVAKEGRIVYPFGYEGENLGQYIHQYMLPQNRSQVNTYYLITKKEESLRIEAIDHSLLPRSPTAEK